MRWTAAYMVVALAGLGVSSVALGQGSGGDGGGGGVAPAAPAAAAAVQGEIKSADDLLRALETADADLRTLTAEIKYLRDFGGIEGDTRQERQGVIYFDADLERPSPENAPAGGEPTPRRGFAVVFEKEIIDGRQRDEKRAFVFDGEWLVEKIFDAKQMIRRRVVPPGEVADPLRIGEGPFPIPIGQKRDDILRRFTVELRPAGEGFGGEVAPPIVQDAYQLRLVPREGTPESRDFREVRLWYRGSDLLPRMARTVNVDGGRSEVLLINHQKNQPTPGGVFDTAPPPRSAGWDVRSEEFRGAVDNAR